MNIHEMPLPLLLVIISLAIWFAVSLIGPIWLPSALGRQLDQFPWKLLAVLIGLLTAYGLWISVSEIITPEFLTDAFSEKSEADTNSDEASEAARTIEQFEALAQRNQNEDEYKLQRLSLPKQSKARQLGYLSLAVARSTMENRHRRGVATRTFGSWPREIGLAAAGDVNSSEQSEENLQALRLFAGFDRFKFRDSAVEFGARWFLPIKDKERKDWRLLRSFVFWKDELEKLGFREVLSPRKKAMTSDEVELSVQRLRKLSAAYAFLDTQPTAKPQDIETVKKLLANHVLLGTVYSSDQKENSFIARLTFQKQDKSRFEGELTIKGSFLKRRNYYQKFDGTMAVEGLVQGDTIRFATVRFVKADRGLLLGAVYTGRIDSQGAITGKWEVPITGKGAAFTLRD